MHHLKFAYMLLVLFLLPGAAIAQNSEKADQMYQDLAYKEAIKLYESKGELSVEDMERIANSYRLNNDTENAALWFEQVVALSQAPINYLYFAQALQSNGAYEKAKKYFLRYNELLGSHASDQRGNHLAAAIDRMNDWGNEKEVVLQQEASINSESLDFSPAFYKDGIVFVSSRKLNDDKKYKWTDEHFMNLYYAAANKAGELVSIRSFSKMINSQYHEGPVAFNKSFDRIFFTRNDHLHGKVKTNKKGVMKLGIFTALRDGDNWTEPKAIDFNTAEYEECHPSLTADGKYLYFASDREGGQGGMDIYVSEFKAGKWMEPTNLGPEINTPGNDVFPFIHDDGTLYFASDGWGGMGGLDIFYVKKNKDDQWNKATNMGHPYNSRKDDFGFILNVLGTEGYLSSSREGGKGKDDIYSFKRRIGSVEKRELDSRPVAVETKEQKTEINFYILGGEESPQVSLDKEMILKLLEEKLNRKSDSEAINIIIDEDGFLKIPGSREKEKSSETKSAIRSDKVLHTLENDVAKKRPVLGEIYELKDVYYYFDKYDVNEKAARELDRLIQIMLEYPTMEIELSSHTDSRGRTRYNQWLSRKRANGAVKYMTDRGINPKRMVAKGYGETMLKNNCGDDVDCSEREHRVNRRTEIRVVKK